MSEEPADSTKNGSAQIQPTWVDRLPNRLSAYSKVVFVFLIVIFVINSWGDLQRLLPRVSRLNVLGVEVEVSQLQAALEKQAQSVKVPSLTLQRGVLEAVLARAVKVRSVFEGATILWVDDEPVGNLPFRRLLRTLGASVEPARSTREALDLLAQGRFDLIVSDIARKGENGIEGLAQLRAAGAKCPAVFYVMEIDPTMRTPEGALGIANRPDVLLHLVIDGLERARWSNVHEAVEQPVTGEEATRRR